VIISQKSIFNTVVALLIIALIVVYGVIYSINSEDANIYSKEINNHTFDSSSGLCGPPHGWYSKN
jgi:hypothetical protein